MDRWERAADADRDYEIEARGRALEAHELSDLQWEAIDQFYDLSKHVTENQTDEIEAGND